MGERKERPATSERLIKRGRERRKPRNATLHSFITPRCTLLYSPSLSPLRPLSSASSVYWPVLESLGNRTLVTFLVLGAFSHQLLFLRLARFITLPSFSIPYVHSILHNTYMETDPQKPNSEFSEEIWNGLDNNAIASLYQQLGYVFFCAVTHYRAPFTHIPLLFWNWTAWKSWSRVLRSSASLFRFSLLRARVLASRLFLEPFLLVLLSPSLLVSRLLPLAPVQ